MPIFSQTTEYAIRAMIELARQPEGQSLLARELTDRLGIPHFYLAKILHQLTRAHLLDSVRGRGGGFSLAKPADQIPLLAVVREFEDLQATESCILGRDACSDARACPLHDFWRDVRDRYSQELSTRSVAELAAHEALWQRKLELGVPARRSTTRKPTASSTKPRTRRAPA